MIEVEVTYEGLIEVHPAEGCDTADEVEHAFSAAMRELIRLGTIEPSVSGSLASGRMEIRCVGRGHSLEAVLSKVDATVRSALHAAKVATPEWEKGRPGLDIRLSTRETREVFEAPHDLIDA